MYEGKTEEKNSFEGQNEGDEIDFDYFKNTKITLDKTIDGEDIYELKADIITNLEPSIIEYDDEQINLIITLIINEYINRYHIDYPIWQEFVIKVAKEEVK